MFDIQIRRPWRGVSIAIVLGLLCMAQAQATYVVGRWDPLFGAPFADLGWRGSVTVDIPADCSELPAGTRLVSSPGCSLPWTVVDAKVQFYDAADPFQSTVESLDFTALLSVASIHVDLAAEIDGFSTSDPVPAASSLLSSSPLSSNGYYFALQMVFDGAETEAKLFWTSDPLTTFGGALGFEGANNPQDDPELRAVAMVREIPEPSTLALAGLCLTVLAAIGWRQRGRQVRR